MRPPLLRGGQGRRPSELSDSGWFWALLAIAVALLCAVLGCTPNTPEQKAEMLEAIDCGSLYPGPEGRSEAELHKIHRLMERLVALQEGKLEKETR